MGSSAGEQFRVPFLLKNWQDNCNSCVTKAYIWYKETSQKCIQLIVGVEYIIFRDTQHAWNPTPDEIRVWAYSDELIPEQDWELAVNSFENIPMICKFVDDVNCKHIPFFLSSLYVFTGDIVRGKKTEENKRLSALLDRLDLTARSELLIAWIARSRDLLEHPQTYTYAYWGLGSKYVY